MSQLYTWLGTTTSVAFLLTVISCSQADPTAVTPVPASTSVPAADLNPPEPTSAQAIAPSDPFREAVNAAMSAATIAQTAISQQDWTLVASRWQQAIDHLKAVPDSSANYQTAQHKIQEYQGNLAIAQKRAQSALQATTAASPEPASASPNRPTSTASATPANAGPAITSDPLTRCQSVQPSQRTQPLEVNLATFYKDEFNPEEHYIVGCITNTSDRAIKASISASYSYDYRTPEGSSSFGGGFSALQIPVDTLQPGQTVPFKSEFSVNQDAPQAEISALYWCWHNENICIPDKEVQVSVTVTR